MLDCIFCKIINGDVETSFLHEDEICVAFNDINPKAKTHVLIVCRKHIPSIADMAEGDEKIIGHMINCAKEIARKLNLDGYKLQFNVGKAGGQEVFHVHLHLLSNSG